MKLRDHLNFFQLSLDFRLLWHGMADSSESTKSLKHFCNWIIDHLIGDYA